MMFSFSGTVMTCTCSSTVTWLYLFLYCYLIYLTTPSAFLNGKVHDLDLVLAYVYQNALLTFHFQLMYLLLNLILTLATNPCDLFTLFKPNPLCLCPFPTPSLNLFIPTHIPQTIFSLTLFFPTLLNFHLSPWYPLYLQPLYSLPLPPPWTPLHPFYLNPFPEPFPSLSVPPQPYPPHPFYLPIMWQGCLNFNCLLTSLAFGASRLRLRRCVPSALCAFGAARLRRCAPAALHECTSGQCTAVPLFSGMLLPKYNRTQFE